MLKYVLSILVISTTDNLTADSMPTIPLSTLFLIDCLKAGRRNSVFRVVACGLFILCFSKIAAQPRKLETWGEVGAYAGSGSGTPFWLRANQFGTVPVERQNFTGRAGFIYSSGSVKPDSLRKNLHWGAGAEFVLNAAKGNQQILFPEVYARVGWKRLELWAGRRKEMIGIVDTTLSSGSFTWSGNALPVPKVQIGFREYVPLKFLKNYIAIKGYFAHGWYNTPYIQSAYLHQKGLYIRAGRPSGRWTAQVGLNHHVTWGGHADYMKASPHIVNGKLTDSFSDYLRGVVLAKISKEFRNDRFTNFDGENRVGNHVGQFDFAFEYKFKRSVLLLYNNHPFEDASGVLFRNMPDGLYGLSWKKTSSDNSFISLAGVLVEYFFSKDQSGAGWNVEGSRFKGNDNYFNHGQYIEGWSYFGRSMGTPLIAPKSEIRPEITEYREFFPNTRVVAYHFGANGLIAGRISWLAKATFSKNFGTNNIIYDPALSQFSGLISLQMPVLKKGNVNAIARIGYDHGDLLPSSLSGYLGVRSSGWIR